MGFSHSPVTELWFCLEVRRTQDAKLAGRGGKRKTLGSGNSNGFSSFARVRVTEGKANDVGDQVPA